MLRVLNEYQSSSLGLESQAIVVYWGCLLLLFFHDFYLWDQWKPSELIEMLNWIKRDLRGKHFLAFARFLYIEVKKVFFQHFASTGSSIVLKCHLQFLGYLRYFLRNSRCCKHNVEIYSELKSVTITFLYVKNLYLLLVQNQYKP